MLKFLFAALLLLYPVSSHALSDKDYKALMNSYEAFRQEDKQLNAIYKKIMKEADADYKKQIREDQRQWLKTELDAEADGYMLEGMSKAQASTKAYHRRYNVLRMVHENYNLPEEDKLAGRVKDEDYYNAMEDAEEEEAREKGANSGDFPGGMR